MSVIAAGRRGCTSFVLDFFVSFFIKKKRKANRMMQDIFLQQIFLSMKISDGYVLFCKKNNQFAERYPNENSNKIALHKVQKRNFITQKPAFVLKKPVSHLQTARLNNIF
jgi:hypothetical protein